MKRFRLTNNNRDEVIKECIKVLNEGGLVVYPTETCYGIAADATNSKALAKLLSYKTFRGSKPISIAVSDIDMAKRYVDLNEMALNIYKNYLPGPITVSYKPHPYSIDQLIKDLPKKSSTLIDMYIDDGELPKNSPSTILDTTLNTLTVLREGQIKFEQAILKSTLLEEKVTKTAQETSKLGQYFTKEYLKDMEGSVVVALSGELGSGKTQFTKGIGKQLGSKDMVNSPTYTIINEYSYDNNTLAHMDTWRLTDEDDFNRSGLMEHLEKGRIVVIEWADKFYQEIESICSKRNIPMYKITFEYISLEERKITIYGTN